jgi:putative SOS response-associated peptidase YedK
LLSSRSVIFLWPATGLAIAAVLLWGYPIAPAIVRGPIPIVRIDPRDHEREVVMARWGLIPFWMKEKPKAPHINARAETVQKLPLFREAFAKRRCLIPATGFYEWQKRDDGKQPYRFGR